MKMTDQNYIVMPKIIFQKKLVQKCDLKAGCQGVISVVANRGI
jgi:hypothetical protein